MSRTTDHIDTGMHLGAMLSDDCIDGLPGTRSVGTLLCVKFADSLMPHLRHLAHSVLVVVVVRVMELGQVIDREL